MKELREFQECGVLSTAGFLLLFEIEFWAQDTIICRLIICCTVLVVR